MPRGSPVPNCRDGLVRFLLIAVPGRSSHPREPMTAPGALQRCSRSFTPSQPAASQPASAANRDRSRGGSSARLREPNRIPRGSQGAVSTRAGDPCKSRGLSACFGVPKYVHCSLAGQNAPAPSSAKAVSFARTKYPDSSWGVRLCRGHAIRYNSVLYLLRRISIITQLSSTPKRCSGSSGMRGSIESVEQ